MVDEVTDITSIKHLAICSKYIDPNGSIQTAFVTDTELPNATAETVTNSITTEVTTRQLSLNNMSGFASDGAAVFTGKNNGVAKKLKDVNPTLISTHCRDHRLALACRDSFHAIPFMKKVDETLEKLYKYYKYSCNHAASLKAVQTAFNQAPLSIKQAKHHRWLSQDQAVSSIVRSYKSIVVDLETSDISNDPVGNGILKHMKDPTTLRSLLLLADTLPHITALSLTFQRNDVNLGMVKKCVDKAIKMLNTRLTQDGPWQLKYSQIAEDIKVTTPTKITDFEKTVKTPFLTQMINNIKDRFVDTEIIDQLSIIDLSGTEDDIPSLYGYTEMSTLATHFNIDPDDLQIQWQDFLQLINSIPTENRTMIHLLQTLHNSENTGLKDMYPLVYQLFSVATTLPLSTAEVERVFSQVKLIKTSHRSRLSTQTLNHILNIKLNCSSSMFDTLLPEITTAFLSSKNRRLTTIAKKV